MRISAQTIGIALISLARCLPACGGDARVDDELAASESDELSRPAIRFGTYDNRWNMPQAGKLKRLVLEQADEDAKLPGLATGRFESIAWAQGEEGIVEEARHGVFRVYNRRVVVRDRPGIHTMIRFSTFGDDGKARISRYRYVYVGSTLVLREDREGAYEFYMPMTAAPDGTPAVDMRCTLDRLYDDNVFEEGLSHDEYPDVDIERAPDTGEIELGIGATHFDTKDDSITWTDRPEGPIVRVDFSAGKYVEVRVSGDRGVVVSADVPTNDPTELPLEKTVATLRCPRP